MIEQSKIWSLVPTAEASLGIGPDDYSTCGISPSAEGAEVTLSFYSADGSLLGSVTLPTGG